MTRQLGIVRALGLIAGGIVLALLLIEGGLRALPQYLTGDARLRLDLFRVSIALDSVQQGDSELGVRWKPNSDVVIEGHPEYRYHFKTDRPGPLWHAPDFLATRIPRLWDHTRSSCRKIRYLLLARHSSGLQPLQVRQGHLKACLLLARLLGQRFHPKCLVNPS